MNHDTGPEAATEIATRLRLLCTELGDPAVVGLAVGAFLEHLTPTLDELDNATTQEQRVGFAHRLAGSAETLGAVTLGRCCRVVMGSDRHDPAAVHAIREAAEEAREAFARQLALLDAGQLPA